MPFISSFFPLLECATCYENNLHRLKTFLNPGYGADNSVGCKNNCDKLNRLGLNLVAAAWLSGDQCLCSTALVSTGQSICLMSSCDSWKTVCPVEAFTSEALDMPVSIRLHISSKLFINSSFLVNISVINPSNRCKDFLSG